jgi:two-component system sensor histidine kinase YesM
LERHPIVEFDKLSQSFTQMAGQLRSLLDQLEIEYRKKRDLELKVLQSQINPHFLYNTLDMINWMAALKGNHEVSIMAANLARFFRISVSQGNMFIPLREELEHARAYAEIQKSRFRMQFVYREQVDELFKKAFVPKIIIQPVIENAFVHGFRGDSNAAKITIRAEMAGEREFHLIVEDNGVGLNGGRPLDESKAISGAAGKGGYGLRNVQERIQLHMGPSYGIQLENRAEGGARVVIKLPYVTSLEQLDPLERGGSVHEGASGRR